MIDEKRLISMINTWLKGLEKPRKRLNGKNLYTEKINVDGEGYFEGERDGFNLVLGFIENEKEMQEFNNRLSNQ